MKRCRIYCGETAARCVLEHDHDGPCCWSQDDVELRDHVKALYHAQHPDVVFARMLERERSGTA